MLRINGGARSELKIHDDAADAMYQAVPLRGVGHLQIEGAAVRDQGHAQGVRGHLNSPPLMVLFGGTTERESQIKAEPNERTRPRGQKNR
jgi:hypothetical protein